MVAGKKCDMCQLCNGVVGRCDIFGVHRSIELETRVEGYLGTQGVVDTHGEDQSAEKCLYWYNAVFIALSFLDSCIDRSQFLNVRL